MSRWYGRSTLNRSKSVLVRLRVTSECMLTTYIVTVYTLFIFKGESYV